MAKEKHTRLIDKDVVRELIADLHIKQLRMLMEKIDDGYIEPQEQRLIWDMVKAHNIGIESVDDLVNKANDELEGQINAMGNLDNDEWTFGE